ncbi:glycosyltransferase [Cellulomonas phragmiteti]|nr:glycosyltransferase [Cellulomonas phragmiteti]
MPLVVLDDPRPSTVRAVCVPADHPYVRAATADPSVVVLPDPPVPGGQPGQWWPPVALDAAWIEAHRDEADLLHVHFGTESFGVGHLRAALDAAHRVGWPVVVTVHDLENPQLTDQDHHVAQLGVLLAAADGVITLTAGGAAAIARRWGRRAAVVPHPRVLRTGWTPPAGGGRSVRRVATHLKDLRPGVDGAGAVAALVGATRRLAGAGLDLEVEVHLRDRTRDDRAAARVRDLCDGSSVTLVEHARPSDDALAEHLSGLDACLLPYGHGTHSGWLELCWDLGVPVVAPEIGHLSEQHPDGSVVTTTPFDRPGAATDLAGALGLALDLPAAGSRERDALVRERAHHRTRTDEASVQHHRELYRQLIAARR